MEENTTQLKGEGNQENQQQQDNNKVAKNFEATMSKLVAILGNKDHLSPKKRIKKDILGTIVSDLLKEDNEASQTAIKTELKELLGKHVTLTKEIAVSEKQFEQLKQNKMKEFNEAANKLFGKIDNLGQIEQEYLAALKSTEAK